MSSIYDKKLYPDLAGADAKLGRGGADATLARGDRLTYIREIHDYLISEINHNERISKKYNKALTGLDITEKSLIVLATAAGGVSIASFASVIGAPVGLAGAAGSLVFSVCSGIIKTITKNFTKKATKHNTIALLAHAKLNSIEELVSKSWVDGEISNGEFMLISGERTKYQKLKENIRYKFNRNLSEIEKEDLIERGRKQVRLRLAKRLDNL